MKFPLLKHVIGIFGLMDASKKSLVKHIAKVLSSSLFIDVYICYLFLLLRAAVTLRAPLVCTFLLL